MSVVRAARPSGRSGLLLIIGAAVLWGTVGVATRALFTLADTAPLSVAFCRLALSLPALSIAFVGSAGSWAGTAIRKPAHAGAMALIGVMLALYQVCFFGALQRVGVAVATLVTLCAAPVLVAVLSALMLRERLTTRLVVPLGAALAGTALLASPRQEPEAGGDALLGVLMALGSATGYALMALLSRSVAREYPPLLTVTVGFGVGALILLPAMLVDGPRLDFPPLGWAILAYLGLVPTAFAYVLFTYGMRTTSATVASTATLIEPLTATALAWLLFGEWIGPLGLVGAVLLLGAMVSLLRGGGQGVRGEETVGSG
jgi:DME family drug/metabolite transporter